MCKWDRDGKAVYRLFTAIIKTCGKVNNEVLICQTRANLPGDINYFYLAPRGQWLLELP